MLNQLKIRFVNYFNFFSNLGIDRNSNPTEKIQRIKLLNQIVSIAIFLQFILIIEGILIADYQGIFYGIISMFICGLPLYLNYVKRHNTAIWSFCLYSPLSIGIVIMLYGEDININYSFIIFCVHLVIFLRSFVPRLIFVIYVSLVYYGAFWYTQHFDSPLAREFSFIEENAIFAVCFLFVMMVLKNYTDLVNENFKRIQTLLDEQQDKQEIIEKQNRELTQANGELEKFAYIASHDLKSPLRNVSSFISLIERKIKKGNTDNLIDDLGFAKRAAQQMYSLIEDILQYSRMREQELSFTTVSLNEIVTNVSYHLKSTFEEKNVELFCEPLPTIEGNHPQLILLFQNLIENGIKYNTHQQPTIKIKNQEEGATTIISIKDNGIGIAPDYQEKVFEMFARLHNQQEYEGTGLGLAICKRIVHAHHGDIWMESEAEKGTTFFIRLPLHQTKQITNF